MPLDQDLLLEAIRDLREKVTEVNHTVNAIRNNLARMEVEQAKTDARLNLLAGQQDAMKARVESLANDFYSYRQTQKGREDERNKADKKLASRATMTATFVSIAIALAGVIINFIA